MLESGTGAHLLELVIAVAIADLQIVRRQRDIVGRRDIIDNQDTARIGWPGCEG